MFVVIEGTDSSGKSTQVHLLRDKLVELGHTVEMLHFPHYESPGGKLVAAYLRGEFGKLDEVPPELAAMIYSVDRYFLKSELEEKINEGTTLITDRYIQSNFGFQGAKFEGEERKEFIRWTKNIDSRLPQADKIIFLDMPAKAAMQLSHEKESPQAKGGGREYLKGKSHDIHEENKTYQEKVKETYLQVAAEEGWIVIKCAKQENGEWKIRTPEDIHKDIWENVKDLVPQ